MTDFKKNYLTPSISRTEVGSEKSLNLQENIK
jgi:hypothetical protein